MLSLALCLKNDNSYSDGIHILVDTSSDTFAKAQTYLETFVIYLIFS